MTDDKLRFLSATEAQQLIARKELSACEYVAASLDAIGAENDTLHAFLEVYRDDALAAAREADKSMARGEVIGPLHGLPFAVKDLIDVEGKRTTAQSAVLRHHVAKRDADVTRQLRAAGAILIGKLTLEEFGIGSPSDRLPWPPARNPWDIERTPGGSSSGCGVALAACQVPLTIGTDTAGSVRNPAAMCGVTGLKPTYDLLSREGVFPLAPSLDHVGLMTRSAEDCALVLRTLRRGANWSVLGQAAENVPLRGLRVGLLAHFHSRDIVASEETRSAIALAAREFAQLGAVVETVEAGDLESFRQCGSTLLRFEAYAVHRNFLAQAPERYGARCRDVLLKGASVPAQEYMEAKTQQRILTDQIDRVLETSDVLIAGVSAHPAALLADEEAINRSTNQMRVPFNVTGHPALSFCIGFSSSSGLPIGAQLIGRRFEEERLLTIAAVYQRVTAWHLQRPFMPFTCRHGTVHRDVWPEYGQSRRDVTLQEQSMMDLPSTPSLRNQGVA
ncbi:amidase [Paraburkholderia caledonica]|jgi:aspartyl-tRNA(Asn)/glutamyl-tRNA(Gln) amidotransferase subunit A|uniref:amidase n=1 Tax=Paraburkholderia caledonica TaxID=134536 RepID=UPI00069459D9|nr:amidase [Paraburkholderia caledonica]